MKLIGIALSAVCVGLVCSVGLAGQTSETHTKSKTTVKDGKTVTVTGCVAPAVGGSGFVLTNVADKKGARHNYVLVSDAGDLAKHVGHRMQFTGKVTDRGDAKITTETKTTTKVEDGEDRATHSKSEVQGDVPGMPYLGVKSMKMISAVCS